MTARTEKRYAVTSKTPNAELRLKLGAAAAEVNALLESNHRKDALLAEKDATIVALRAQLLAHERRSDFAPSLHALKDRAMQLAQHPEVACAVIKAGRIVVTRKGSRGVYTIL